MPWFRLDRVLLVLGLISLAAVMQALIYDTHRQSLSTCQTPRECALLDSLLRAPGLVHLR